MSTSNVTVSVSIFTSHNVTFILLGLLLSLFCYGLPAQSRTVRHVHFPHMIKMAENIEGHHYITA